MGRATGSPINTGRESASSALNQVSASEDKSSDFRQLALRAEGVSPAALASSGARRARIFLRRCSPPAIEQWSGASASTQGQVNSSMTCCSQVCLDVDDALSRSWHPLTAAPAVHCCGMKTPVLSRCIAPAPDRNPAAEKPLCYSYWPKSGQKPLCPGWQDEVAGMQCWQFVLTVHTARLVAVDCSTQSVDLVLMLAGDRARLYICGKQSGLSRPQVPENND